QVHAGLVRRPVALPGVAALAAGHDVLPRGRAAAAAREHVVEGEVVRVPAAVLADVLVAPEDVLAVERHALPERRAHEAPQPDHAGYREHRVGGAQHLARLLDTLGDLVHEQRHGALHRAHVQRLVARVEDEDAAGVEVRQRREAFAADSGRRAGGARRPVIQLLVRLLEERPHFYVAQAFGLAPPVTRRILPAATLSAPFQ